MSDTIALYNAVSEAEKLSTPLFRRAILEKLSPLAQSHVDAGPTKPHRILDVGIGRGYLMRDFSTTFPDWDIFGVDGAENALAECAANGIPQGHLHRMDLNTVPLPFPDGTFDITLCTATLRYLNNNARVIEDMIRVTKPSGHVLIQLPLSEDDFPILATEMLEAEGGHYTIKHQIMGRSTLTRLFERAKIRVQNSWHDGRAADTADYGRPVTSNIYVLQKNL